MNHFAHLLTPTELLFQIYTPGPRLLRNHARVLRCSHVQNKRFASQSPSFAGREDRLVEFTKDEQIETAYVRVKKSEGGLGDPERLRDLLRTIDRNAQVIVQRSKPGERPEAIVEVCDRLELLRSLREREETARQQARAQKDLKPKQIEMNWAIGENDLEMKLKQLEQFLNKGKKVEILLAAKKRQRRATNEEGSEVLRKIREKIHDVGARETKMEGVLLKQATLTVKKISD